MIMFQYEYGDHRTDRPAVDSVWKHYNGNLYTVESFLEEGPFITVVCRDAEGRRCLRPLKDWYSSMSFVS